MFPKKVGIAVVWGIPKELRPIVGIDIDGVEAIHIILTAHGIGECQIVKGSTIKRYSLWYPEHVNDGQSRGQFVGRWGLMPYRSSRSDDT